MNITYRRIEANNETKLQFILKLAVVNADLTQFKQFVLSKTEKSHFVAIT